jgi:hypothetical protein
MSDSFEKRAQPCRNGGLDPKTRLQSILTFALSAIDTVIGSAEVLARLLLSIHFPPNLLLLASLITCTYLLI